MRSIANKITWAIALCTIAFTLLLGILIHRQADTMLTLEAERNLTSILNREAEALDQEFLRVKRLALTQRSIVQNTLDLTLAQSSSDYMAQYKEQLNHLFKDTISNFANISGWILFNSRVIPGTHTVSYTFENQSFIREPEYDVIKDGFEAESWWADAIKRGENWTAPYYWEPWDADIISYSIPVLISDQLIGVTGAEFFLKPFQERLRNIKVYDTGFIMLIQHDGTEIYLPSEIDSSLIANWYSSQSNRLLSNPTGIQYKQGPNQDLVIAWKRLSNNWLLIAMPKKEEMFDGLRAVTYITLITLILSVPFALALGLTLSKTITKPLVALTLAAQNTLTHQPSTLSTIHSTDHEIITLTKVLTQMQTEVQSTLSELSLNEQKYRSLVENAEHLIFTINTDGHFTTTNRRLEAIAGVAKEKLIGMHFTTLFNQDESKLFWNNVFKDLKLRKEKVVHETQVTDSSGKKRTVITSLIPIIDHQSTLIMVMGTGTDITERLEIEQQINRLLSKENEQLNQRVEQKAKELESALKELMEIDKLASLGRLVAGIAHEINTPLGNAVTISSYLESTYLELENTLSDAMNPDQSSDTHQLLATITEATQSLQRSLRRTSDLVDTFKTMSINPDTETISTINLYQHLDLVIKSYEKNCQTKKCTLELICSESLDLTTYPSTLTLILMHLMGNVFQHAFPESHIALKPRTVRLEAEEHAHAITLHIKDNGIGMSETQRLKIFEPFYTTDRSSGSAGLGLTIVFNGVVNQLNGKITCDSEESYGTHFTITLPKN